MRRLVLLWIMAGLALAAGTSLSLYLYLKPATLRVAVVRETDDHAILTVASQELTKGRRSIRLKLVVVDNLADTSRAIEDGRADLAVVRSDVAMPATGQTVLIMRKSVAVLMAPPQTGLHAIDDLRGRRIGILHAAQGSGAGHPAVLDMVLDQYDIPPSEIRRVALSLHGLQKAIEHEEVDLVLALGAQGSPSLSEAVNAVARAAHAQPVFIPITEAKAIAQRSPFFEQAEVVRGAFGGAQPRPAADFETLGVSTRLVASHELSGDLVSELMQVLLEARQRIGTYFPAVNSIEAPPTDKGAAFPVHPGAAAYLDNESETFFDRYGDLIYIGAMLLSLFGTGLMAVSSRVNRRRSSPADRVLERLIDIIKLVQSSDEADTLDQLQKEADALLFPALAPDSLRASSPNHFAALNLAMNEVRHAVAERRQMLAETVRTPFAPRIVRD